MAVFKKQWEKMRVNGLKYGVTSGHLRLTKEQAADRVGAVRQVKGNVYEVIGPVEFKRGEVIEVEAVQISKVALSVLTPVEAKAANREIGDPEPGDDANQETGGLGGDANQEIGDPGEEVADPNDPTADGLLRE